jgi:hypothetical protein
MRRHSKEGREPVKARRRKTVTRKRLNAPKASAALPLLTLNKQNSRGLAANGTRRRSSRRRSPTFSASSPIRRVTCSRCWTR